VFSNPARDDKDGSEFRDRASTKYATPSTFNLLVEAENKFARFSRDCDFDFAAK
jgi:hypothetical protein